MTRLATDLVTLGKSGLRVSLVGMGTGTIGVGGFSNQTRLGAEAFNRLVHHAIYSGINFFDCADMYGSNPYLGRALKGVPRECYVLQTKTTARTAQATRADIDRFRLELDTDYIDSLMIHCATESDWTEGYRSVMDVMEEAKQKGIIRAHGVTCHSYEALTAACESDWVDLNMVRWNAGNVDMDGDQYSCGSLFQKMRRKGQGMIGMKVFGQGDLVREGSGWSRLDCLRFQLESGVVDSFIVGLQSTEECDDLLRDTQTALDQVLDLDQAWDADAVSLLN